MVTESSTVSVENTPERSVRPERAPYSASPAPQPTSSVVVSEDASSVDFSARSQSLKTEFQSGSTKEASGSDEKGSKKSEQAERIAKQLEQALNSVAGTKVSFGVEKITKEASGDINFRVVDKDTGKTVLEFPPESLYSFEKALARQDETGLLVNVKS